MDNREQFLLEVHKLHLMMEDITQKYDIQGEVVNIMLTGMLDYDDFGEPVLKAVYSLDVDNEDLLQEAFDFLQFSYSFYEKEEEEDEINSENWYQGILADLGIVPPSMN
tara:strand:+ start:462 stop:788 length:327 start_codon:yes stop_codon:yes gene_type:complete